MFDQALSNRRKRYFIISLEVGEFLYSVLLNRDNGLAAQKNVYPKLIDKRCLISVHTGLVLSVMSSRVKALKKLESKINTVKENLG